MPFKPAGGAFCWGITKLGCFTKLGKPRAFRTLKRSCHAPCVGRNTKQTTLVDHEAACTEKHRKKRRDPAPWPTTGHLQGRINTYTQTIRFPNSGRQGRKGQLNLSVQAYSPTIHQRESDLSWTCHLSGQEAPIRDHWWPYHAISEPMRITGFKRIHI